MPWAVLGGKNSKEKVGLRAFSASCRRLEMSIVEMEDEEWYPQWMFDFEKLLQKQCLAQKTGYVIPTSPAQSGSKLTNQSSEGFFRVLRKAVHDYGLAQVTNAGPTICQEPQHRVSVGSLV
jgi:hypothetical protein